MKDIQRSQYEVKIAGENCVYSRRDIGSAKHLIGGQAYRFVIRLASAIF